LNKPTSQKNTRRKNGSMFITLPNTDHKTDLASVVRGVVQGHGRKTTNEENPK
jgi:hypothetical protein